MDLHSNLRVAQSLVPAARTATASGTSVDRAGTGEYFQSAMVVVTAGTVTDGTHTIEVQHSANGSSWSAVPDSELDGAEPAIGSSGSDTVHEIEYLGLERYLRVHVTVAGATTGGVYGAAIILGAPRVAPVVRS